jgi:hypothetical protein
MGLDGYVGSAEDTRRIRRQEKQREEQKKKFEDLKKQSDANVDAAGLRQFGTAKTEVRISTSDMIKFSLADSQAEMRGSSCHARGAGCSGPLSWRWSYHQCSELGI